MAKSLTTTELRKMQPNDLQKEIMDKKNEIAKMDLQFNLKSFTDSAKYRRTKKELARLKTIEQEQLIADLLKEDAKSSTVPASTN